MKNEKFLSHLVKNWDKADTFQEKRNLRRFRHQKRLDLLNRITEETEFSLRRHNQIEINEKNKHMFEFKDVTEDIERVEEKVQFTKTEESFENIPNLSPDDEEDRCNISSPPIINIEKSTLNACPSKVAIRDKPSKNLPVLTTYFNQKLKNGTKPAQKATPSSL